MNRKKGEPKLSLDDPVAIAKRLEQESLLVDGYDLGNSKGGPVPADFAAALMGLKLVRRSTIPASDGEGRPAREESGETLTAKANITFPGDATACPPEGCSDNPGQLLVGDVSRKQLDRPDGLGRLGRFEIVRQLGRGGFGVVLLGRDPELDRLVALKVPRLESLVDADARGRFEREACLVSTLSHPAIVPVYEYSARGAVPFIAFALCKGDSLAEWFFARQKEVSPDWAARIVWQLAGAMQYAHQRGVVHRDLKPGNVLLDLDQHVDNGDNAIDQLVSALRITDFGLAKSLQSNAPELTREGAIVGTPCYMAPEQVAGRSEVTPAVDVYALGAILYELLTGQPPLQRESDLATMRAVENEEPRRPRQLRKSVPADLEAICLNCLEKEPHRRYATAHDLQQDLERFLEARTVVARRVSSLRQLAKWCRRNPALAVVSLLAFVSLAAGCGVATWQWWRAENNLAEMQSQSNRATRHLGRLEKSVDRILSDVSKFLIEVPQSEVLQNELLQGALQLQEELLAEEMGDPQVIFLTCQARRRTAELYLQLGNVQAAIEALQAADILLQSVELIEVGPKQLAELGRVQHLVSDAWCRLRNGPNAVEAAEEAVDAWHQYFALEPGNASRADWANAVRQLGVSQGLAGENLTSGESFLEAVDLLMSPEAGQSGADPNSLSEDERLKFETILAKCLNSLGIFQKSNGQFDQAAESYSESVQLLQAVIDRDPARTDLKLNLASTALNLGNLASFRKQFDDAEQWYLRSAEMSANLSLDFPQTYRFRELNLLANTGLGLAQKNLNRCDDAIVSISNCIEDTESANRVFGSTPVILENLAKLHSNLANIHLEILGDTEAGEAAIRKSMAICDSLLVDNPDDDSHRLSLSIAQGQLAMIVAGRNELPLAMKIMESALDDAYRLMKSNEREPRHVNNLVWMLTARSGILSRIGDDPAAIESARRITDIVPGEQRFWIEAAKALGQCVNALQADAEPDSNSDERIGEYVASAAEFLGTAREIGRVDIGKLLQSSPLNVFQDFPQVQSLGN